MAARDKRRTPSRPVGRSSRPQLAAALIVKNEEANLPDCLRSLDGVVDEVVIYDTGSTDATVEIAEAAGARVVRGYWDGDFARARNEALALTDATWVLSIDADERVIVDRPRLRAVLVAAAAKDVVGVRIHNVGAGGSEGHEHTGPRLLYRSRIRWVARLHEHPVRLDGAPLRKGLVDRDVLRLDHLGYSDAEVVAGKIRRNVEIAQSQLDAVVASGSIDTELLPRILINLGRSHIAAHQFQQAVDTLETLRELAPGTPQYVEGTSALAEVLADHGPFEGALVLADELERLGVQPAMTSWIRARALVRLGRPSEALALLGTIDKLVDPVGRLLPMVPVLGLQVAIAEQLGRHDEAIAALVVLMVRHGKAAGNGPGLLRLWGNRPPQWLADLMVSVTDHSHLGTTLAELESCPEPGPTVATHVRAAVGGADATLGVPAPQTISG